MTAMTSGKIRKREPEAEDFRRPGTVKKTGMHFAYDSRNKQDVASF